jgi:Putative prokaryotic signal transducing protein
MASRWCPKCGAEYREGFSECADCGVALVDVPPAPKPREQHPEVHGPFSPDDDTVELLRTNPIEAEVIVARLQSEGIPAAFFGSEGYDSYGPLLANADGARVMVRRADLEVATALARESD